MKISFPLIYLFLVLFSISPAYSQTIHAFNVFCDQYKGEGGDINQGVTSDRFMINELLTEQISEAGWGVKVSITEIRGHDATGEKFVEAWRAFGRNVAPNDTVFIYFSGHGAVTRADGNQFLQLCDGEPVNRTEWAQSIDSFNCRLKIFITDCCSTFLQTDVVEGDDEIEPWNTLYHLFMLHEGFVNITAASPGEGAWASQIGSIFTINLHSDMQRFRTWEEVFRQTKNRVVLETTEAAKSIQTPFAYSLARYNNRGGRNTIPSYIIPDSDRRLLSRAELTRMGLQSLYLARNEIVARHGYDFSTPLLRKYFAAQHWYRCQPGKKTYDLSAVESKNAVLIRKIEEEKGGPFITYVPGVDTSGAPPDIFPHSSSRVLSRTAVDSLNLMQLSLARNEIFARHGYPFKNQVLARFFAQKPGYRRNPRATSPNFNKVEQQNIWLIRKVERIKGGAYRW